MGTKSRVKRIAWWLVVVIAIALAVLLIWCVGPEWSEAIVQGLAALGALWYWAYRSRPRVTLRLLSSDGIYLELANVGNRVATHVRITCDPPIPWSEIGVIARRDQFGPIEDFGDMSPGQRYTVMFGSASPQSVDALDVTTFEVSHESTWGIRRRRSTMSFGGSGAQSSLREGTATPIGEIAKSAKAQRQELGKIRKSIDALPHRLAASSDDSES